MPKQKKMPELIPKGKDRFLAVAYSEIPYLEISQHHVSFYTSLRIRRDPPDICFMFKDEGFLVFVKSEPFAVLFPCRTEIRHSPDPAWRALRHQFRYQIALPHPQTKDDRRIEA